MVPRLGPNHARLLGDQDIRRWHANLARRSKTRADIFLRQLDNFCIRTKTEPKQLPKLGEKEARDLLLDFVDVEQKSGKSGGYTLSMIKSVQSWLIHNGCKWDLKVNIDGAYDAPTLEKVPPIDQDGLSRIFHAASPRERAASVLVAHAGLRLESLGDYLGEDGLSIADLPEMRVKGRRVSFEKVPTLVVVRSGVSKTRRPYFTFLGSEGCQYLAEYIEGRARSGEKLLPSSPVIVPERAELKFIRTTNIGDLIRTAIRKAGLPNRPYDLRVFFGTQLQIGGPKAQLPDKWRLFWMGHVVDRNDRPYNVGRARMNLSLVAEMREAYHRAEPFLSTGKTVAAISEVDLKKAILAVLLPEDEVAKLDVSKMTTAEVRQFVTERLQGAKGAAFGPSISLESAKRLGPVGQHSKGSAEIVESVVRLSELRDRLANGWHYVTKLPNGEAVIRRPANGEGSTSTYR